MLQQIVEGVRIQQVESPHHNIGRQMLAMATHADAAHPRSPGALDTRDGIFYNNAAGWRYAETFCRENINFRIRLAFVHVFTGDNSFKHMSSRQDLKDRFDIGAGRGGSDCLTPSLPMQPVQPTCYAGQR